jgi:large subunit ribosomal protein L10
MQAEKQILVQEVGGYLAKSNYVFLADFTGLTVANVETLRSALSALGAEFHVVKNTILELAAKERQMPDLSPMLKGPTAIIVGGKDAASVAKAIEGFVKDAKKLEIKGGALDAALLSKGNVAELAKLPPMPVLQAQFLALLNTPATQLVRVIQGVPQGLLNVLQAKVDQAAEAAGAQA